MRTLEEQTNWLSDYITILQITEYIYITNRPWMKKGEKSIFIETGKQVIDSLTDVLESLYILLERDQICDNCVNQFLEQFNNK